MPVTLDELSGLAQRSAIGREIWQGIEHAIPSFRREIPPEIPAPHLQEPPREVPPRLQELRSEPIRPSPPAGPALPKLADRGFILDDVANGDAIRHGGHQYGIDRAQLLQWSNAVVRRQPPPSLIWERIPANDNNAAAAYVLVRPSGEARVYFGNASLRDLHAAAAADWEAVGGSPPVRLTLTGRGTALDFDTARLTLLAIQNTAFSAKHDLESGFSQFDRPMEYASLAGLRPPTDFRSLDGTQINSQFTFAVKKQPTLDPFQLGDFRNQLRRHRRGPSRRCGACSRTICRARRSRACSDSGSD